MCKRVVDLNSSNRVHDTPNASATAAEGRLLVAVLLTEKGITLDERMLASGTAFDYSAPTRSAHQSPFIFPITADR